MCDGSVVRLSHSSAAVSGTCLTFGVRPSDTKIIHREKLRINIL